MFVLELKTCGPLLKIHTQNPHKSELFPWLTEWVAQTYHNTDSTSQTPKYSSQMAKPLSGRSINHQSSPMFRESWLANQLDNLDKHNNSQYTNIDKKRGFSSWKPCKANILILSIIALRNVYANANRARLRREIDVPNATHDTLDEIIEEIGKDWNTVKRFCYSDHFIYSSRHLWPQQVLWCKYWYEKN